MQLTRLTILLLVGISSAVAYGQEFTGRVSDSTGAAIPKATVTVHSTQTNNDITTQSNKGGDYTVPYLKSGQYIVTATATGFETSIKEGIILEVGKTAVINFH